MGKNTNLKLMVKLSFILVILGIYSVCQAKIIYVDDSALGANDGSSWTDACIYLQDALAGASSGDEIRVAHGVYAPDSGGGNTVGDRYATFQLKNGVTIKGGYVGLDIPEKSDERAFNIFETILSGNLNEDNDPNLLISFDSCVTVVTGSNTDETAVLDGFTIINSEGTGILVGACIDIDSGNPTIKNCTFIKEDSFPTSLSKSAFSNSNGSSPAITDCTFTSNSTGSLPYSQSSHAIMENDQSSPVLMNCTFKNNKFCMSNSESNIELKNCVFQGNSGTSIEQDGGSLTIQGCSFRENAMSSSISARINGTSCIVFSNGILILKDSTFTGNSFNPGSNPFYSAGIGCINNSNGKLTIADCTFSSNSGGVIQSNSVGRTGLYSGAATINNCVFINNSDRAISGSNFIIQNCRFCGNSASEGSAMYVSESDIHNCIFEANNGSAISIIPSVYRELYNCTFYGNMGTGGVIKNISNKYTLNLTNCILRNNNSNVIEGSDINVTYCNIEGGFPGEGNIDVDPDFVRAGYWADVNNTDMAVNQNDPNAIWVMGDYHLKSQAGRWDSESETWVKDNVSSPCIDAGNINAPIGFEPSPNGGVSNLGAYGRSAEASKTFFEDNNSDVILAGDINGDSIVDYNDLYIVVSQWSLEGNDFINQYPKVTFIEPQDDDQIIWTGKLRLQVQAIDLDGEIVSVEFYLEQRIENSIHSISFSGTKEVDIWSGEISSMYNLGYGTWTARVTATDNEGAVTKSTVTVTIIAP